MSHLFKVGDKCRIARSISRPESIGRECVIIDFVCRPAETIGVDGRRYGAPTNCTVLCEGNDFAINTDQLEPLNPPKSQIDEILAMKELPDFEIARVAA